MKVLVIGGSGLFGRKIVIHLLRDDDASSVVSMDLTPPPEWFLKSIQKKTDKFRFVRGDVCSARRYIKYPQKYSL